MTKKKKEKKNVIHEEEVSDDHLTVKFAIKKDNVIELGVVKDVQHNAEHLRAAFKISDERAQIIGDIIQTITEIDGLKVSEVLVKTAEQLKGNELLYGLFLLGKFHGNRRSRMPALPKGAIPFTGDISDLKDVLDKMLSGKDKDKKD